MASQLPKNQQQATDILPDGLRPGVTTAWLRILQQDRTAGSDWSAGDHPIFGRLLA